MSAQSITEQIRCKIEKSGEAYWRLQDFPDYPASAVSQALSRLARAGELERVSKGLYYRSRQSVLGPSRPSKSVIRKLPFPSKSSNRIAFPAGLSAANLLGFTTQNAARLELATPTLSLPRTLVGEDTKLHTRRPEAWVHFSAKEAALMDFIRQRGKTSELSPEETSAKLLKLLSEEDCFQRLAQAALSEPPRVRAILGAAGQQLHRSPRTLKKLRESLNPLSRFEFGLFSSLDYAHEWQAKERKQ